MRAYIGCPPALGRTLMLLGIVTGLALGSVAAVAAEGVDPDADRILREMTQYMGGLSAFSVVGDVDDEIVDLEGQKLQFSSSATLLLQRPGRVYAHRQGPIADVEVFFDGRVLTLHGKRVDAYVQHEVTGTIDDAITAMRSVLHLGVPAGDLLYSDAYDGLMTDVRSGTYLGTAYVYGTEVHHLAFRADKVDWQIWVKTGEQPLPMKYVITTKWLTGAPEYTVRFRDWNTSPTIDPGQFAFTPSGSATKVDLLPVSELGSVNIEEAR